LNTKFTKFFIYVSIFCFFILPIYSLSSIAAYQSVSNSLTSNSSGNYFEDFADQTYMDGATTAYGWGMGTLTNRRNISIVPLDFFPTDSPLVDVDVQGHKAYVAHNDILGDAQVSIFDLSSPGTIRKLSSAADVYHNETKTLCVNGDVLFVGQRNTIVNQAVVFYDVEDPFTLSWGWASGINNRVTDIDAEGYLYYYTSYNNPRSFRILYAEDVGFMAPTFIEPDWASTKALGVDVEGDLACIAASDEGFYILNVTDKYSPVELSHLGTPGNATDVLYEGHFAYVSDGEAGFHIIDVSNPNLPVITSSIDTPGYTYNLVKQGRTLFVADGPGEVLIYDIADPSNPAFVTAITGLSYVWDLDLFGDILVIGTNTGLASYRIGMLANLENNFYLNAFTGIEVLDVRVVGDIAYVAAGSYGLITLNVRDPSNPTLLDQDIVGLTPNYYKVFVKGTFVYVADYGNGFRVYDVRDPTNIKQIGYRPLAYTLDVFIAGDIAYIADGPFGVFIYNISDPFNIPSPYANIPGFTNVTSVWVQGQELYVAEDTDGTLKPVLFIYDLTDISTPVLLGSETEWSRIKNIYVDGDVVLGAQQDWTIVFNATDTTNPFFSDWAFPKSYGVWGFGPYFLNANPFGSVDIFNASDIENYNILSSNENASAALKISTSGDYTYAANQTSLVILRHFLSAGDTYIDGISIAQSTEVDGVEGVISEATLDFTGYVPSGSHVDFFMSADGGAHWEAVTPGTPHTFTDQGGALLWRAEIGGPEDRSVHINTVEINFEYNAAPTVPTLEDPGTTNALGLAKLNWSTSIDDGAINYYIVEMSDSSSFGTILKNSTTTDTSESFAFLSKGTYYFRVRAVDVTDLMSAWSNVEDLEVTFGLLSPMWLGIIGGGLVALIIIIVIIAVVVRRKKKVPTR